MRVRFHVDSGANVGSDNASEWFDPVDELGLDEGEWETLSDVEKWEFVNEWAGNYLDIYYEER